MRIELLLLFFFFFFFLLLLLLLPLPLLLLLLLHIFCLLTSIFFCTVNLQLTIHSHNPAWFHSPSVCCWLNADKTKVVNFTRKINTINHIYKLCDECITPTDCIKDLGILWVPHPFFNHSKCWHSYMHWHILFLLLIV